MSTVPSISNGKSPETSPQPNLSVSFPHPPVENLTSHFILGELIEHLPILKPHFPKVKIDVLQQNLWQIRNKDVDPVEHLRGFCKAFEDTPEYQDEVGKLDEGMKRMVGVFAKGGTPEEVIAAGGQANTFNMPTSTPSKHHFTEMVKSLEKKVSGLLHHSHENLSDGTNGVQANGHSSIPQIYEDSAQTKTMLVYGSAAFNNWGKSVSNIPLYTFVPSTVLGLQNLIKWAKTQSLRVRCSGYRHSWSSTFGQDKHILVSLLGIKEVTTLPDDMSITSEGNPEPGELKSIEIMEVKEGGEKALCRVGAAVTNEQFRRWAVKEGKWSLPVDVILVEVTMGGVNGPICHGAGLPHQTINDYVRGIEYIDCNGHLQTIIDPAHLKAAAGCFGLLGVVTHITFELDKMTYALLRPTKPDIGLAIPPLSRDDIPIALRKTHTDIQYANALADFKSRVANDYYSEYFWFTYNQQAWVNTFNTTSDTTGVIDYPDPFQTFCQWLQGWLGHVITANPIFNAFPGRWQAQLLATLGMVNLPPFQIGDFNQSENDRIKTYKTALPNALHFRRGVQNMVVRDMEYQIPIPSKVNPETGIEEADWDVVRKAWWDVIKLVYEFDGDDANGKGEGKGECPMRLTLEMRIMGGSGLVMAPQRGNKWGTCSIEVLSLPDAVSDGEWTGFLQRVSDLWMGYTDSEGKLLNVRPHWAKEWESVDMRGMPSRQYLKEEAYKEAIPEFKTTLADIGSKQGWNLTDLQTRFSNELWDYMIYD